MMKEYVPRDVDHGAGFHPLSHDRCSRRTLDAERALPAADTLAARAARGIDAWKVECQSPLAETGAGQLRRVILGNVERSRPVKLRRAAGNGSGCFLLGPVAFELDPEGNHAVED